MVHQMEISELSWPALSTMLVVAFNIIPILINGVIPNSTFQLIEGSYRVEVISKPIPYPRESMKR